MILRIFAVVGIISIIAILRFAEFKAYNFDYKQIPSGIISWVNFIFIVYLIWFWLGHIM